SAIFLRQGEAAFFLRGTAPDRMKRFAALVDLSQYTALSQRAQTRSNEARRAQQRAEGKLEALGNVSDDALHVAEEEKALAEQARARGAPARGCPGRAGRCRLHRH